MTNPYSRAPHQGALGSVVATSPHAALLIDFDNVTMGMRSDLSKELKNLLDSDVIKGKVSVQRAYADWRRYPQYIVPLSEASVDLIFAPAYGSNKKNATDIRMAIDAVELVFIRPEIGTFILLTGDSDFSSLVLKLKEYGKYVIGVGIQESSSDILVQNCDEYYSYTSLTGLTKTTELGKGGSRDAWVLVKEAVERMVSRDDVMRSDRLKQVMQELDSTFDESGLGFSKFSKFLAEASSRGLVELKKLDNGQYEIGPAKGRERKSDEVDEGRGRRERRPRGRRDRRDREPASPGATEAEGKVEVDHPSEERSPDVVGEAEVHGGDPLQRAYRVLTSALEAMRAAGRYPVRDSDVKRKMLEIDDGFDETELGFPKFSRFLGQAADQGVVALTKTEGGGSEVSLADESMPMPHRTESASVDSDPVLAAEERSDEVPERESSGPTVIDVVPPDPTLSGRTLGPRRGSTRRRGADEAPPLFEGQAFTVAPTAVATTPLQSPAEPEDEFPTRDPFIASQGGLEGTPTEGGIDLARLGLPSDPGAIVRYLTHRYKGVGEKTAETLVETFGAGLFATLRDDPEAVEKVIPAKRAEQLLEAWQTDYERRTAAGSTGEGERNGGRDGRRGGRNRPRGRSRG